LDLLIKGILDYSSIDKQQTDNRIIDLNLLVDEILTTIHVSEHVDVRKLNCLNCLGMTLDLNNYFKSNSKCNKIMTKKKF
jgi:hypothetical protein